MKVPRQQWVLIIATAVLAAVLVVVLASGGNRPAAQEVANDAAQACTTLRQAATAFTDGSDESHRVGMELLDQAVRTIRIAVRANGAYAPVLAEADAAHRLSHSVGPEEHARVEAAIASALQACVSTGATAGSR